MPWFGTVAFWGITWGTIVLTVASIVIGSWQASRARQAARDAFNASLRDRLVSVSTTTAYRSRVYGTVRNVDGILFKASHGQDLRYYTFVVATRSTASSRRTSTTRRSTWNPTARSRRRPTGARRARRRARC